MIYHRNVLDYINTLLKINNFKGSYLFYGKKNLGKYTLALEIAQKILGQNKNQILFNPNFFLIKAKNKTSKTITINIDEIRNLRKFLNLKPFQGQSKFVIVDDFDLTSKEAQNALLKNLEEPPVDTVLILIVNNIDNVLTTVLSRCQIIEFNLQSFNKIYFYLKNKLSQSHQKSLLISFLSQGRPGLAHKLLNSPELMIQGESSLDLILKFLSANLSQRFKIIKEIINSEGEPLIILLEMWQIILRELVLEKITGVQSKALSHLKGRVKYYSNPNKLVEVIQYLNQIIYNIKYLKIKPKLLLEGLALKC